jgi:hypothetical protein
MLIRMPPDPPEKWGAVESALETAAKTRRLCAILLLDRLSVGISVGAILAVAILAVLLWH